MNYTAEGIEQLIELHSELIEDLEKYAKEKGLIPQNAYSSSFDGGTLSYSYSSCGYSEYDSTPINLDEFIEWKRRQQ